MMVIFRVLPKKTGLFRVFGVFRVRFSEFRVFRAFRVFRVRYTPWDVHFRYPAENSNFSCMVFARGGRCPQFIENQNNPILFLNVYNFHNCHKLLLNSNTFMELQILTVDCWKVCWLSWNVIRICFLLFFKISRFEKVEFYLWSYQFAQNFEIRQI